MTTSQPIAIRTATEADVPLVFALITELAEYEHLAHAVTATEAAIRDLLFGAHPIAEAFIAEYDGAPAGFSLIYYTCSTFAGKAGIYLEDLFVRPAFRKRGLGKALLIHLAQLAQARGYCRLDWMVLNWNESSIQFYQSLGATPVDEWTTYRLAGNALHQLADQQH